MKNKSALYSIIIIVACISVIATCYYFDNYKKYLSRDINLFKNNTKSFQHMFDHIKEDSSKLYKRNGINNKAFESADMYLNDFYIQMDADKIITQINYKIYTKAKGKAFVQNVSITSDGYNISVFRVEDFDIEPSVHTSYEEFIRKLNTVYIDRFMEKLENGDMYTLEYIFSDDKFKNDNGKENVYINYSFDDAQQIKPNEEVIFDGYCPFISIVSLEKMDDRSYSADRDSQVMLICLAD